MQNFLADLHLAGRLVAEGVLAGIGHECLEDAAAANGTDADRFLRLDIELGAIGKPMGALSKTNSVSPASFSFNAAAKGRPRRLRKPCNGPIRRFSSKVLGLEGLEQPARHNLAQLEDPVVGLVMAQGFDHRLAAGTVEAKRLGLETRLLKIARLLDDLLPGQINDLGHEAAARQVRRAPSA